MNNTDYTPPFRVEKDDTLPWHNIKDASDKSVLINVYKEDCDYICHALNQTYGGGIEKAVEAVEEIKRFTVNSDEPWLEYIYGKSKEALSALKGEGGK